MSAQAGILKAAGIVAFVSLVSKLLGFIREASLAAVFGATYATDAYLVGQTVPTLIFAVVTAALGNTFIPVFSEVRQSRGDEAAMRTVNSVVNAALLIAAFFVTIGEALAGPLTRLVAPGFVGEVYALTVEISRIMFPMLLFQAVSGLFTGMLQANDNFAVPAIATLAFNTTIIASIVLLGPVFGIRAVAIGTVVAIALQALLQLPALHRVGFRWQAVVDFRDPGLRRMASLMGPVLLSAGALQVSIVVNRVLASNLTTGSIAALNYATRLMTLVPGVIGVAIVTVMYPTLARMAAARDWSRYGRAFSGAIKIITFTLVPVAVGLLVLCTPLVELVFQRGAFDAQATRATAWALLFLSPAVALLTLRDMISRAFFALQDTVTPMVVGVATAGLTIVLNLLLVGPLAHGGLALATSLAAAFETAVLLFALRGRIAKTASAGSRDETGMSGQVVSVERVGTGGRAMADSLWRVLVASAAMGVAVRHVYGTLLVLLPGGSIVMQAIRLFGSILLGVLVYAGMVVLLRVPEAEQIIHTSRSALGKARSRVRRRLSGEA